MKYMQPVTDLCRAHYERAQEFCSRRIEEQFHSALRRIHKAHFHRHEVYFLDAMGSVFIKVGEHDVTTARDGLEHVFSELDELLSWYCAVADEFHIQITELRLQPIHSAA